MELTGEERERAELFAAVAGSNSARELAEALERITGPGDTHESFVDWAEEAITAYLSALSPSPTGGEAGAVAWRWWSGRNWIVASVKPDPKYHEDWEPLYTHHAPLMDEVEAVQWRDMDSAPKDETNILYCTKFRDIGFCHWDEGYNEDDEPCWWDNERDDEVCPIAWLPEDTIPSVRALLTKLQEGER